jgi:protein TonB
MNGPRTPRSTALASSGAGAASFAASAAGHALALWLLGGVVLAPGEREPALRARRGEGGDGLVVQLVRLREIRSTIEAGPEPEPVRRRPEDVPQTSDPPPSPPEPVPADVEAEPPPAPAEPPADADAPAPERLAGVRTGLAGAGAIRPRYPRSCRRAGHEGVALLRLEVSRDGLVFGASLLRSAGCPELDRAALEAAREARLRPPETSRGDAVAATVDLPVRFELR